MLLTSILFLIIYCINKGFFFFSTRLFGALSYFSKTREEVSGYFFPENDTYHTSKTKIE